jgi:hypothetical protein
MGSKMNAINLGKKGADTKAEYRNLVDFLGKTGTMPEWVVLQSFGNDIVVAYKRNTGRNEQLRQFGNSRAWTPYNYSYLGNYIYWSYPHNDMNDYFENLRKAYRHDATLREHFSDLDSIVSLCRNRGIRLRAVISPFMQDPASSRGLYVEKVGDFFKERGVPVVDPTNRIERMNIGERIVNHTDMHASVSVNRIVAGEILSVMQR